MPTAVRSSTHQRVQVKPVRAEGLLLQHALSRDTASARTITRARVLGVPTNCYGKTLELRASLHARQRFLPAVRTPRQEGLEGIVAGSPSDLDEDLVSCSV